MFINDAAGDVAEEGMQTVAIDRHVVSRSHGAHRIGWSQVRPSPIEATVQTGGQGCKGLSILVAEAGLTERAQHRVDSATLAVARIVLIVELGSQ